MKRLLLVAACALLLTSCARSPFTVYAQSLPITKTIAWDANPVSDAVSTYSLWLDTCWPSLLAGILVGAVSFGFHMCLRKL